MGCDQAGIAVGGSDGLGTNQTSDNTGMAVDGVGWGHGQAGQLENDLIVGSIDGQSTSMTGESPGMAVDGRGWEYDRAGRHEHGLILRGNAGQSTNKTSDGQVMAMYGEGRGCDQAGIAVGGRDLSVEDQKSLRLWARKLSNRSFGSLKLCRDVIDMNETL